jgi:ectoine hydroxylase-related dioxygenase (phytanoyl-CoA dioxygenase family)|tara:strand:- start:9 stop:839 length:831 start_codon:yes stop_codon:yes gene_type:complete
MFAMVFSQPEVPSRLLFGSEIEALRSDGVICAREVLSDKWIALITLGIERAQSAPTALGKSLSIKNRGFTIDLFMWLQSEDFRAIVFDSPLAHLAQQVLNSSTVTHWYDQLFLKEPGSDVPTPWHHDLTFWPISGDQIVSIWVPVDSVTCESSGLEFVKASHRWPNRFKAITADYNAHMINPELEDVPDIDSNRDQYEILSWDLEPGDVLIFHPLTVHGSPGNSSNSLQRRALASRWVGADVVYSPKPHTMPLPANHGLEPGDQIQGPLFPTVLGR